MNDQLPQDRQAVQVTLGNSDWQPATFRRGQFIDAYGLPLDPEKISDWRPVEASPNSAQ